MKRYIFILAGGILALTLILVISCSKEEIKSNDQNQEEKTPYEQQVTQAIKDFKEKVTYNRENHGYKNGNGEVDMSILTQKYDKMIENVTTVYENSTFEDKGLVLVDLSEISQDENEIIINVQAVTGKGISDPNPPVLDGPFEEGDDWWYGENVGHCYDPYVIVDDAANQIYQEALDLIPDPNGNYYFINEFSFTIQGGDSDFQRDQTPDNHLDYWLYYSIEGSTIPFDEEEVLCLEYTEMNAYYTYLNGLMFDYLPNTYLPNKYNLNGYSVEALNLVDDGKNVVNNNVTEYFHKATFAFGIKVNYDESEGHEEL